MKIPKLSKETSLFNKNKTVETSFKLLADSITSIVTGQETYTDPDGNTQTNEMGTMIRQTLNNVIIQATRNSSNAAQAGAALITSLINVATEGITISSDKVNIEGAAIFSSGRLSQNSLDGMYSSTDEVQYIYIQAVSGTNSVSGTTTWVSSIAESVTSDTAGLTPVWTTKRPTYRSNYPVIFTAKQTKTVSGTVTCTMPVKDDTLTVIDGGHITTGTIDAARIDTAHITVGSLQDGSSYAKTADIPTKTSDLTNDSSFETTTGAQTKANTAKTEAISAAATDATTKANAAAKTATDYITVIDNNGIKVHASNNSNTNYSKIDADGLNVIKNSISVAKFGETARVGKLLKGYIEIGTNNSDNGYIDMYNADVLLCHIGYDAGIDVDGGTSVAPYYTFGIRGNSSLIGNYSIAEGTYVAASGYTAHAEGSSTEASGTYSHAEGTLTKALGAASHAEGFGSTASSDNAHVEGRFTEASGSASHAEGYGTKASGDYSHAEGYFSKASGNYSHAEGDRVTASGAYSHAEGYFSTASKDYSHAESYKTTASGAYSHAEGYETTASGDYSHAEGYQTTASGYNSHASGARTKAAYANQFVCGVYNRNISNSLFEVGNGASGANGASDASLKNAFTVLSSGSAYFNGTTSANGTAVTSDARVKTLIDELSPETSINFIKQLQPKHYYKEDVEEYGFYAQEVEEIPGFGEVLVKKDNSGLYDLPDYRLLNYQGLIAPIVSVEQNLIERVEKLEKENAELKKQIEQLIQIAENSK